MNKIKNKKKVTLFTPAGSFLMFLGMLLCAPAFVDAQASKPAKDSVEKLTLDQCIAYALQNQPGLNQALINQEITRTTNAINLSGWLPQVSIVGSLTHYNQLPTSFNNSTSPPTEIKSGVTNTAIPTLAATETVFAPELLYAARSASLYVKQAQQITDSAKIGVVANVSKAFYNLLQTLEQIKVLKDDTTRLGRTVLDTYHQYKGGLVDATDYEESVITLNNSKGQLRQQVENITPQYAALKQLMGYPTNKQFNVLYDTAQMRNEIAFDTTQALNFEKRIEYQQLQTSKELQHQLTDYYTISSLPTLTAFYDYFYEYENNNFSQLFNTAYPYSYLGLSLNIPIFTGFSHFENIHKSKLQEQELDWSEVNLKANIYSQYTSAMANYKSSLYNMQLMKDNDIQANKAYTIVTLQYRQGVVAYLNLIVAESNLISAEVGYINALFQVLSSKIDLEKAIGIIPVTPQTSTTH